MKPLFLSEPSIRGETEFKKAIINQSLMIVGRYLHYFLFRVGVYMGVSLNGGTPISHPKCESFLVGKSHGFVGETQHFRKPPYSNITVRYILIGVGWLGLLPETQARCGSVVLVSGTSTPRAPHGPVEEMGLEKIESADFSS